MNERVFEVEPIKSPSKALVSSAEFHFITYAVEIEGEAPLYFSIEAVDE